MYIWLIPLQSLALTKSLLTVFIKLLSVISIAKLCAFISMLGEIRKIIVNRELPYQLVLNKPGKATNCR